MKKSNFNDEFLFGSAAAAYHFEGAYNQDGKGLCISDVVPGKPSEGRTDKPTKDNLKLQSIDFYNRYMDDVKLFSDLGLRAFRTSIAWSRIFPKGIEDEPNEKGLQFYDNLFDELLKHGIEPVVTITHTSEMPLYLAEKYNGFLSKEVIDYYLKFAETVMKRYKNKVKYWFTFNEINATLKMPFYNAGVNKPSNEITKSDLFQTLHNQLVASSKAIEIGKKINEDFQFSCTFIASPRYPMSPNPDDVMESFIANKFQDFITDIMVFGKYNYFIQNFFEKNDIELDVTEDELSSLKSNTVDFLAFSYYNTGCVSAKTTSKDRKEIDEIDGNIFKTEKNPYLETNEWNWQLDPIGMRYTCNRLYDRYEIPLFIVENGHSEIESLTVDQNGNKTVIDNKRIQVLKEHLIQLDKAIGDGVEVIGYTNWAVMDFVSGTTGTMLKRWGFIYVDYQQDGTGSLKRYKKKSFDWYKKVIETNGEHLYDLT